MMRLKKRSARILLSFLSFLLAITVAEVALRIAGVSAPIFAIPDAHLGVKLLPNAEGWWREEGNTYLRINSAGFRDREHSKSKPQDTFRIAVLGDSFAEARQVEMEDTFWWILEKRMQLCRCAEGKRIEVLNFGVPGYGTAQELISLRRNVWDYSPDVVLLAVTTGNDIRDNSPILSQDGPRPFFVYQGAQLVLDESMLTARENSLAFRLWKSPPGQIFEWLRQHSRILQLINKARTKLMDYRIFRRRADVASGLKKPPGAPELNEPGLDYMVYYEPQDPAWQDAWHMTEGTLQLMRDEVRSKGAQFFVVTLSSGAQVTPDPQAREAILQSAGLKDLFYPDRRIKELGERVGFPVLNLAPLLAKYAEEHRVFLHGFGATVGSGHWNQEGHRVAGAIISDWLCEQITSVNARSKS